MKIIGITGGIGSGKSTLSKLLSEAYSINIIDADVLSRQVMEQEDIKQEIVDTFGRQYLNADQTIDRKKLGEAIFPDSVSKQKLEDIIHPHVRKLFFDKIAEYRAKNISYVIYDCPLLVEAGLQTDVDMTILAYADEDARIERIMKRNGLTRKQVKDRLNAQMKLENKIPYADIVVYNSGTYDDLKNSIGDIYWELTNYVKNNG